MAADPLPVLMLGVSTEDITPPHALASATTQLGDGGALWGYDGVDDWRPGET